MSDHSPATVRDRTLAVLTGRRPDRPPFIGRLELWQRGLRHTGNLPAEFRDLSLTEIHQAVGMGRQIFLSPFSWRLRGVELISSFNGEMTCRKQDPIVDRFPDVDHLVPPDQAGITVTDFITQVGRLTVEHTLNEPMLAAGARPYVTRHPIQDEGDYRVAEWILERAEYVPRYDRLRAMEEELGDLGYVVPSLNRIPFQQLLIDYFSTEAMLAALFDESRALQRLADLLDEQVTEIVRQIAALDVPYVEFVDNLDGMITSPRLFREHCLPAYRRYLDALHSQGKRVGSHTDGNLRPLLGLLREAGLDVCESVSPYPLTPCTFEEIWKAWQDGPLIWGGIPSPILEERTGEAEFEGYMVRLLQAVGDRPIVLCVADMVLPNNSIDRIRRIVAMIESAPQG